MGFFSRLKDRVVEAAYSVADSVVDYVSEKVGRRSHPGCGSVYMRDMQARDRRIEHARAARAADGYPREGYKQSEYDNVVDISSLEHKVELELPVWAKRPASGSYKRTGTYD